MISLYFRRGSGPPRYLDEEEYQRKFQEQQRQIAEYKQFRQQVEQWREQDKQLRNMTKERQLQECEELQVHWFPFISFLFTLILSICSFVNTHFSFHTRSCPSEQILYLCLKQILSLKLSEPTSLELFLTLYKSVFIRE